MKHVRICTILCLNLFTILIHNYLSLMHAPQGYGNRVCMCVCLPPQNWLPTSFLCRKQIGFFMVFSRFLPVVFAENALFKSASVICWSMPPSSLPNKLLMDKWDIDGFFLTRKESRSNTTTSSLLITILWQISLDICHTWHGTAHVILLDIICNCV